MTLSEAIFPIKEKKILKIKNKTESRWILNFITYYLNFEKFIAGSQKQLSQNIINCFPKLKKIKEFNIQSYLKFIKLLSHLNLFSTDENIKTPGFQAEVVVANFFEVKKTEELMKREDIVIEYSEDFYNNIKKTEKINIKFYSSPFIIIGRISEYLNQKEKEYEKFVQNELGEDFFEKNKTIIFKIKRAIFETPSVLKNLKEKNGEINNNLKNSKISENFKKRRINKTLLNMILNLSINNKIKIIVLKFLKKMFIEVSEIFNLDFLIIIRKPSSVIFKLKEAEEKNFKISDFIFLLYNKNAFKTYISGLDYNLQQKNSFKNYELYQLKEIGKEDMNQQIINLSAELNSILERVYIEDRDLKAPRESLIKFAEKSQKDCYVIYINFSKILENSNDLNSKFSSLLIIIQNLIKNHNQYIEKYFDYQKYFENNILNFLKDSKYLSKIIIEKTLQSISKQIFQQDEDLKLEIRKTIKQDMIKNYKLNQKNNSIKNSFLQLIIHLKSLLNIITLPIRDVCEFEYVKESTYMFVKNYIEELISYNTKLRKKFRNIIQNIIENLTVDLTDYIYKKTNLEIKKWLKEKTFSF